MSRTVQEITKKIIDFLEDKIDGEDKKRISKNSKFIYVTKKEYDVIANSKIVSSKLNDLEYAIYVCFEEKSYFAIVSEKYQEELDKCDECDECDEQIKNGIGALLINEGFLNIKNEVTSLEIIDDFLGIEEENIEDSVKINLVELLNQFFGLYKVFEMPEDSIEINYKEDIDRYFFYLTIGTLEKFLDFKIIENIRNILLLDSSRSLRPAIMNIYGTTRYSSIYLELYRCIEYLYVVNKIFEWKPKYNFEDEKIVELVINENLRFPERTSIISIISKYAEETIVDEYYKAIKETLDVAESIPKMKKAEEVAELIYQNRCRIAHFKYKQENNIEENYIKVQLLYLSEIVLSVFRNIDKELSSLCLNTSVWEVIDVS